MDASSKPFVFVLMPFQKEFDDIYKLGIKQVCKEVETYCERVDEQHFEENILERIYNQIVKADIIISDMTGKNPNVFYETGYAHALNKKVILLTQKAEDIPFDLKHFTHIVYEGNISDLKTKLKQRIKYFLKNPKKSLKTDSELEIFTQRMSLKDKPELKIELYKHAIEKILLLSFDLYNPNDYIYDKEIYFGIVFPENFQNFKTPEKIVRLPQGGNMILKKISEKIFPKCWEVLKIQVALMNSDFSSGSSDFVFKIFTEFGEKHFPFKVTIST